VVKKKTTKTKRGAVREKVVPVLHRQHAFVSANAGTEVIWWNKPDHPDDPAQGTLSAEPVMAWRVDHEHILVPLTVQQCPPHAAIRHANGKVIAADGRTYSWEGWLAEQHRLIEKDFAALKQE
jgi:hypothetical protein